MKTLLLNLSILLALSPLSAFAQTIYVHPYTRSNGTEVLGYYKTAPNKTRLDNWSTKGNVNPYTGKTGYQNPDSVLPQKNKDATARQE